MIKKYLLIHKDNLIKKLEKNESIYPLVSFLLNVWLNLTLIFPYKVIFVSKLT